MFICIILSLYFDCLCNSHVLTYVTITSLLSSHIVKTHIFQGFGPWIFVGIRIKIISILFYITWISIRCIIYPVIMKILCELWYETYSRSGCMIYQCYSGALILHSVFCLLNFKWTFDLFRSKYRALRSGNRRGHNKVDKGL